MEWISVKDRLPDIYDNVIIMESKNSVFVGRRATCWDNSIRWYKGENFPALPKDYVKYWVPFPEPPKE